SHTPHSFPTRRSSDLRSLPKPPIPDFPIRGYEYYDNRDEVVNTTFVNYQDNALRKTGALSWLLFTSAAVSTESTVEGAEFVNARSEEHTSELQSRENL